VFWSGFGQVVILLLIQIGGLGIMIFASLIGIWDCPHFATTAQSSKHRCPRHLSVLPRIRTSKRRDGSGAATGMSLLLLVTVTASST
jgi:hypothetical protein